VLSVTSQTGTHGYRIFAVRYGHRDTVHAWEAFHKAHAAPELGMDYFVWAITDGQRTVVVDTGFAADEGIRRGRQFLRSPDAGLAELGIDAGHVEHVVLSHFHWDHIGGQALFPRAMFHVQAEEMRFYTGREVTRPAFRASIFLPDIISLVTLNYEERVTFHAGDAEILPGIWVHHTGGHTAGMQIVSVETTRGRAVLTSDASHYYANMDEGNAFNTFLDLARVYQGYDRIRALAAAPELIIPGHDPLVLRRLKPVADGIVEL
jgi:glyoxylase-like metal-dependent hydrolase (beta-lactamase superfamily II)